MLVSMKEMLSDAKANKYAIPAFDISNCEMMKAVLDTCEELKSPALLQGLQVDFNGRAMNLLVDMVKSASNYYSIPICLHLDHALDLDYIKQGINAGFSSVMLDASVLDFENNAKKTREVVEYAHARGITVEAELGHVGNAMVGNESDKVSNEDPEDSLTLPEEVKKFVEMTEVDALAIAIGTAHGVYKKTPTLRIDRLDEITKVTDVALVLHGGSGTPDEQMKNAIKHGITKINIYSDILVGLNAGLKNKLNTIANPATWPHFVFEEARILMKNAVKDKILKFGSNNRI